MSHHALTQVTHATVLWVLAIVFALNSLGYRIRGDQTFALVFYVLTLVAVVIGDLLMP